MESNFTEIDKVPMLPRIPRYSKNEMEERDKEKRRERAEEKCQIYRMVNQRKEARARAMAPGPMREVEEKEKINLKRKLGQNWGTPKVRAQEMAQAKLNPIPSKAVKGALQHAKVEKWNVEQKIRREKRKKMGVEAELHYNQYLSVVEAQTGIGLKETDNLGQRLELLRKSVTGDRQAITTSHLAKTLAFMGDIEGAKVEMSKWKAVWSTLIGRGMSRLGSH